MKKTVPVVLLGALVLVQAVVSWSVHLRERASGFADNPARKIRVLERSTRFYPGNETAFFELGKAYFDQAQSDLDDPAGRDSSLARSTRNFLRSLRLDPGFSAGHFHLAQSLLYMTYLGMETPEAPFEEYKKAALLTGHNTQVYFEVGKILLSRWDGLPDAEKAMSRDILRKMLAGRDTAKFRSLLEIWYLHSRDNALIDSIIPADAAILRTYATFLGERSLPIGERKEALGRAELLDFQKARSEFELGQRKYDYFQTDQARGHLAECLRLLDHIRFYAPPAGRALVDGEEYKRVLRDAHLLLARIEIDRSRSLADPNSHMQAYLGLEDRVSAVADFEKFLRERDLLGERGAAASTRTDFTFLSLELTLDFLQNRYRDITRLGETLENRLLVVPDGAKADYARILGIIGESYFKLDFVYEAERYLRKALDLDPARLEVLLGLERCYERLNDRIQAVAAREAVSSVLTPAELPFGPPALGKGETRTIEMISDGQPADFVLDLVSGLPGQRPLVTVVFGGRVVWEDYVEGGRLTFSATPEAGANTIQVRPVNIPVTLTKLRSSPSE